jgi:ABC-type nitrate/sulfonate/bicarbonate transport system substrate-binding protein
VQEHPNFEWFFLLVDAGRDKGFWTQNGLDPDVRPVAASAEQLAQQIDSGIRLGFVNTAEVLLASSRGSPVKIVAGYFGSTTAKILVKDDGRFRSLKDLDGKRIGVISQAHTSFRAVSYINRTVGIKAEPVTLGNLENNMAALNAGTVDAFYSAEGAVLPYVRPGALRILLPLADIYPKPYTAVAAWATDDLIKQEPSTVKAFVKAVLEIVVYLKSHPSEAADLYVRRTHAPRHVAEAAVSQLLAVLSASGKGSGDDLRAAVDGSRRFTTESGGVPSGVTLSVAKAVEDKFLP